MHPQQSTRPLSDNDKLTLIQDGQLVQVPASVLTAYTGAGGAGSPGVGWTSGVGAPNDGDGKPNGTLYLDTDPNGSYQYYQKAGGTYGAQSVGSLRGRDGIDGATNSFRGPNITTGTPAATLGNIGEAAYDPNTGNFWAPKQASTAPTPSGFFGLNTHLNRGWAPYQAMTPSSYASLISDLGVQIMRTDMTTAANLSSSNNLAIINSWIANGCTPLIVITPASYNVVNTTYAANYSAGQTLGIAMANAAVAGISDPTKIIWECTNELDFICRIDKQGNASAVNPIDGFGPDGSVRTDFIPAAIEMLRGLVGGMIAGIKSIIPTAKCGMATGNPYSYVVQEMLIKGMDTTGAITQTPIPFDFVCLHWYKTMNNVVFAGPSNHRQGRTGGTGSYCPDAPPSGTPNPNVLALLQSRCNGLPTIVSEWGTIDTEANQASYLTSQYAVWFSNRVTYNIQAVLLYTLFADTADSGTGSDLGGVNTSNYGLIKYDGSTKKAAYTAMKSYHASNTTPGTAGWPGAARVIPAATDIPSACNIFMDSPDVLSVRRGTNNQTLRIWQTIDAGLANGSFGGMWYAGGNFHFGTDKIGTGSPPGTRYTINGIDLLAFNAGSLSPVTDQNYNLGSVTTRYLRGYFYGINLKIARTSTSGTTLANPSAPSTTEWTGAGAGTITVEAAPEDGQIRIFVNSASAAVSFTVNYTGRAGASTLVLSQDQCGILQYNATGGYWMRISTT
jgi:hypothetical protein